jgi:hypothetical protein
MNPWRIGAAASNRRSNDFGVKFLHRPILAAAQPFLHGILRTTAQKKALIESFRMSRRSHNSVEDWRRRIKS